MRSVLTILLACMALTGSPAGFCLIRTKPLPLPRPYVTDGLTHYWDAEFNKSRAEHEGATTVWKDLVGNRDLTLRQNGSVSFTAHSAKFWYTSYWSPTRSDGLFVGTSIPDNEIKTVEICALFSNGSGGFSTVGQNYVMFSNGATERSGAWGSRIGDKNSTAPYYFALAYPHSSISIGCIARLKDATNVGYTRWNIDDNTGERCGATFQNYVAGGFTISGCNTNSTDVGGSISQHFWKPDTLATYWGYNRVYAYTNQWPYTTGHAAAGSPRYTPTEPVGTGLSVGGVVYDGSPSSFFYGYIYAIRIYNRRLTIEERQHNAAIDYQAFKGKKE